MNARRAPWKSRLLGLAALGLVFASGLYASAIAAGQAESPVGKTKPTHPTDTGETETDTNPTGTTPTTPTTSTTPTSTTDTTPTTSTTPTGTTGTTATTSTTSTIPTGTTATTSEETTSATPAGTGTTGATSTASDSSTPTDTTSRGTFGSNGPSSTVASAAPRATLLVTPKNGSRIRKPPLFRWVPVKGALYYNLQLYRAGRKVLSVWPSQNRYALARSWIYKKRRYSLTRGLYTWFVWPGVGPRAAARYGKLLGRSSFLVASP